MVYLCKQSKVILKLYDSLAVHTILSSLNQEKRRTNLRLNDAWDFKAIYYSIIDKGNVNFSIY